MTETEMQVEFSVGEDKAHPLDEGVHLEIEVRMTGLLRPADGNDPFLCTWKVLTTSTDRDTVASPLTLAEIFQAAQGAGSHLVVDSLHKIADRDDDDED